MKEIRSSEEISQGDNRIIRGYAIVFNSLSNDLGGFREIILPSAVDEDLIKRSDILCLLDHNRERGVLARSKNGIGSLKLSIDERGLGFEYDCPDTQLGQEVYEGVRRGDITSCSFAFVVGEDRYERSADGTVVRYISKIKQLYDISQVYNPAYDDTYVTVDTRSYDAFIESEKNNEINIQDTVNETENRTDELLDRIASLLEKMENRSEESPKEEERNDDEQESPKEEDEVKNDSEEEVNEDERSDDEQDSDDESEERNNNTITSNNKMEKFSLVKAIRDVAEGRSLDETTLNVIKEGRSEMQKAGLSTNGQIVLPSEYRADNTNGQTNSVFATVATKGAENVATDLLNIVEPLRNALVTNGAGFTFMSGLVGNVEFPVFSGTQCYWESETSTAKDAGGEWSKIKSSPKRLSATLQISKLFLAQDSNGAEEMLKRDIMNALREKLEMTILGNGAGDNNTPTGLFNGVVANTTAFKYDDYIDMQKELMSKNVNNYKIVCSPSAYAVLRTTKLDSGSGRFLLENGNQTVDGINVYVTNNCVDKGIILADFSEILINSWSGIELVVDPYSLAAEGMIKIVVNGYFDCITRRPDAVVAKILK